MPENLIYLLIRSVVGEGSHRAAALLLLHTPSPSSRASEPFSLIASERARAPQLDTRQERRDGETLAQSPLAQTRGQPCRLSIPSGLSGCQSNDPDTLRATPRVFSFHHPIGLHRCRCPRPMQVTSRSAARGAAVVTSPWLTQLFLPPTRASYARECGGKMALRSAGFMGCAGVCQLFFLNTALTTGKYFANSPF